MVSPSATITEPSLRAGQHGELAIGKRRIGGLGEAVHLVEAGDLLLVGEHDVGAFADERSEIGAVAVDAKGIRQSEGDLGAGFLRKPRRRLEGLLRLVAVEQIAFEIDDLAASISEASRSAGAKSTLAPRNVFMVRSPSGVTKMRQRAVGSPSSAGGVS